MAAHVVSFKSLQASTTGMLTRCYSAKCHCSDVAMSSFDYFEVRYQASRPGEEATVDNWIKNIRLPGCFSYAFLLALKLLPVKKPLKWQMGEILILAELSF